VTTEDRPLFYQDTWVFQDDLPTLSSRYTLTLPDGWKASSVTFNRPEVQPQVTGTTYAWELRDLPPIADEPMSPSFVNIAPRLAVNYSPPTEAQGVNKTFADWLEVSKWASALHDSQVVIDDAVAAKTQEVTANAKTELDTIRAIGSYVQNLQYISIDIGVGYGNGYKPRPSNLVMSRGYGDCKDKVNLMRAMLRAVDITSYPVAIFSGDPDYVREEWASPQQFNHAVVAIVFPQEKPLHSVFRHPSLGPLMVFDPTDSNTPVGELPEDEQGSFALIVAGDRGDIVRMPASPSEANRLERIVEAVLGPDGSLTAKVSERSMGHSATMERREFHSLQKTEYQKMVEAWVEAHEQELLEQWENAGNNQPVLIVG
jgi:hypothetical protein